jgi:hypothetical protein
MSCAAEQPDRDGALLLFLMTDKFCYHSKAGGEVSLILLGRELPPPT